MNERKITVAMVEAYDRKLKEDEHAAATREKYLRSVRAFAVWLDGAAVTKEAVTEWKAYLAERRQAPSTVNTALGRAERLVPLPRLGGLPREVPQGPAPHFSRSRARADARGV